MSKPFKIIANIGFIIGLFVLTIATIFCLITISGKSILPVIGLIGVASFLWLLSIRSLIYYKTFVHFRSEEKITSTNPEIDTKLIQKIWEREHGR